MVLPVSGHGRWAHWPASPLHAVVPCPARVGRRACWAAPAPRSISSSWRLCRGGMAVQGGADAPLTRALPYMHTCIHAHVGGGRRQVHVSKDRPDMHPRTAQREWQGYHTPRVRPHHQQARCISWLQLPDAWPLLPWALQASLVLGCCVLSQRGRKPLVQRVGPGAAARGPRAPRDLPPTPRLESS